MIAIESGSAHLNNDSWDFVDVSAACASISRAIPGERDRFKIGRAPHQGDLEKVLDKFTPHNNRFEKQAAIWIITDNADWKILRW
jgi:hypothetical protein